MPTYSWRRRPTKHFGEVWVPFAHIALQDADGAFHSFAVQIDSGAVVSLLRRSALELLGVDLETGTRVDLSGIGGKSTTAFLHMLPTRFGDDKFGTLSVQYAVAEGEDVPNLLGRRDVFDALQVHFDATLHETRLAGRWLTEEQAALWRGFLKVDKDIVQRWNPKDLPVPAKNVVPRMLDRAAKQVAGVAALAQSHRVDVCVALLRSLFELSLQFEYLMQDPGPRALQREKYHKVTSYKRMCAWRDHADGELGKLVRADWSTAEISRVKSDYVDVRRQFERAGGGIWDAWYCMSVRDLAREVNREREYAIWYAYWSDWMHGKPSRTMGIREAMMHCYLLYGRMLKQVTSKMILTAEDHAILEMLNRPFT